MNRCSMLPTGRFDHEIAPLLYSPVAVRPGFIPAITNDLLVASVAIGKTPLLAADFERIAAVSSLRLAPA